MLASSLSGGNTRRGGPDGAGVRGNGSSSRVGSGGRRRSRGCASTPTEPSSERNRETNKRARRSSDGGDEHPARVKREGGLTMRSPPTGNLGRVRSQTLLLYGSTTHSQGQADPGTVVQRIATDEACRQRRCSAERRPGAEATTARSVCRFEVPRSADRRAWWELENNNNIVQREQRAVT